MRKFFLLTRLMQMFASALATLTVVVALSCVGGGLAIWTGAAPAFNWRLTTDGQRLLVVHNGPNGPACPTAPPDTDCADRIPGRRTFYARYVTPGEVRLLARVEFPDG